MIPYGYPLLARKCHSLNSLIPTEKTAITSATITCRANWEGEAHCDTETSAVSEVIPLLVQAHYISIKDVSGMLLILKHLFLFIFFQDLPELSCASAQRGGPRTAVGQWLSFSVQGDNQFRDLRAIFRTMLWSGGVSAPFFPWRSKAGGGCFHLSAAARTNALTLPSPLFSNHHPPGFPQLNRNSWFIISFISKMFV